MLRLRRTAIASLTLLGIGCSPPDPGQVTARQTALKDSSQKDSKPKDGKSVWIVLKEKADLSKAVRGAKDWKGRGQAVYDDLRQTADKHQAGLRQLLRERNVEHQSFWIVNAIRVTADEAVVSELSKRPEVERIIEDVPITIPPLLPAADTPHILGTEWGLNSIRAPEAWSTFGARGEGIVVANIDTGVQFDHPALARQYRGAQTGAVDHNYNWYDPAGVCTAGTPCDNNGHGTHTMGTMLGDDGTGNQIGVAPQARWIAAKGCESNSCSTASLLAAGQWMLAPTDLNGQNPRPDLRPNIINNSWGNSAADTFYQALVQSWVAAGIFPAFSNGNSGSSCNTAGSPGSYPESFAAGAYDSSNVIASFSSRGASPFGNIVKPNIAAPGVSVRSSVPTNGYASYSGTSMASPHVAGAVALLWSAAPALLGDVAGTAALLGQTAVDVADTSCGGTAQNNNVWGEGRLDVFEAVNQAPRGPSGRLHGVVTSAAAGTPIAGATVTVNTTPARTATASATGEVDMRLPAGTYRVTVTAYAYQTTAVDGVVITEGTTTERSFALTSAPSHAVSGTIRDALGAPVPGATVTIVGAPVPPVTSDASGRYRFATVLAGELDLQVAAGRCLAGATQHVVLDADATVDFALAPRIDSFGYYCQPATPSYVQAETVLSLTGDDYAQSVTLPFPFTLYGQSYSSVYVATNGVLSFAAATTAYTNSSIPSTSAPNATIYAFWDDLYVDSSSSVRTQVTGTAPTRQFVVEWRNVRFFSDSSLRVSFEVVLEEGGDIVLQYGQLPTAGRAQGNSATVGIENATGTVASQYSYNEAALGSETAIRYRLRAVCSSDDDCSDGAFCNGAERCVNGACQAGTPIVCNDETACTADVCDESADACRFTPNHAACSDGLFCNGEERCVSLLGCSAGAAPCDELMRCDEQQDRCEALCTSDAECADASFCNGVERCVEGRCQPGTPVACDDGIDCTADACDETALACSHLPSHVLCGDGLFCNGSEVCEPTRGCVPGTPPCPQYCDEQADTCTSCAADTDCSDGLFCNGSERCVSGVCQAGTPVQCDDGVACTANACDEATDACQYTPDNAACSNGLFCDGTEVCDATRGCTAGTPPCSASQTCDEGSDSCQAPTCTSDAQCDDADFCNGSERCVSGACQPGTSWGAACYAATPLARNQQSGSFNSTGEKWFVATDDILGWQASEVQGRTIRVNGIEVTRAAMPLPAKYNNKRYFQFTAGEKPWASWSYW